MLQGQHKKIDIRITTLQKNISKATLVISKAADPLTKRAKAKYRKEMTNNERTNVIVRNLTQIQFSF